MGGWRPSYLAFETSSFASPPRDGFAVLQPLTICDSATALHAWSTVTAFSNECPKAAGTSR